MDTKTGDIYEGPRLKQLQKELRGLESSDLANQLQEMLVPPTPPQLRRKPVDPTAIGRVGRNEPCPCGSGKKFKFCHLNV